MKSRFLAIATWAACSPHLVSFSSATHVYGRPKSYDLASKSERDEIDKASSSPAGKSDVNLITTSTAAFGLDSEVDASSNAKYKRRRKNRLRNKKDRNKGYDYYDEDDYYHDRDDGYTAPDAGYSAPSSGYNAPSSGYNAPSYEAPSYNAPSNNAPAYNAPSSEYGAPSYNNAGGGTDNSFIDFLNALVAFLPIALFLAAIPPNLITINTRKKRDLVGAGSGIGNRATAPFPIVDQALHAGVSEARNEDECLRRLMCELEADRQAGFVWKAFRHVTARYLGADLNKAGYGLSPGDSEMDRCERFKC